MDEGNRDCNKQKKLHLRRVCKYLNVLKYKYDNCISNVKKLKIVPNAIRFILEVVLRFLKEFMLCLFAKFDS